MLKNRGKGLEYQGVDGHLRSTLLRLRREVREHCIGGPRPDNSHQLLTRRPAHAGETSERCQQQAPTTWPDARNEVKLGSHVSLLPRQAMERHREPVGFVSNSLDEKKSGALGRQGNRVVAVTREQ